MRHNVYLAFPLFKIKHQVALSTPPLLFWPCIAWSKIAVAVRPCQLNEYLDPRTKDVCISCTAGYYNLDTAGTSCCACPSHATCSDPCVGTTKCSDPTLELEFMVPQDGYWHSNMFSDQVRVFGMFAFVSQRGRARESASPETHQSLPFITWWMLWISSHKTCCTSLLR